MFYTHMTKMSRCRLSLNGFTPDIVDCIDASAIASLHDFSNVCKHFCKLLYLQFFDDCDALQKPVSISSTETYSSRIQLMNFQMFGCMLPVNGVDKALVPPLAVVIALLVLRFRLFTFHITSGTAVSHCSWKYWNSGCSTGSASVSGSA